MIYFVIRRHEDWALNGLLVSFPFVIKSVREKWKLILDKQN